MAVPGSNSSFYANNAVTYTENNPAANPDQPNPPTNNNAPSSFYKASGGIYDASGAFDTVYFGPLADDPTLDPSGEALTTGDMYFSTTANSLRVYNGTSWQPLMVSFNGRGGFVLPQTGDYTAAQIAAGQALTSANDTNVTLTLGGTPASSLLTGVSITAGWTGTLAATRLNGNVVQAVTNDTNITGSIASQTLTLGFTGTLAAARLNSNVVQLVTNDTNVTGSIASQRLTLGWTGTLAATRLNDNVVQAVTNDTNVTGSIASQDLTLGWTGTLAVGRGGSGAATFTAHGVLVGEGTSAFNALAVGATGQGLMGNTGADPSWTGSPSYTGIVTAASFNTTTGYAIGGNLAVGISGNYLELLSPATASAVIYVGNTADSTVYLRGNANVTIQNVAATYTPFQVNMTNGGINLAGTTSGVISLVPQAAAGSYNWNWPTTAGSAGQVLTSQGGGSNAMTWTSPSGASAPRGYIDGLILSNDGTTPNTVLDIAAGVATDSTNATLITLASAFTKSISGAWASGTGSNGMGNGLTATASTWYHVILANNNGVPDIYFDTDPGGANRPTGITDTKVRRIGSFRVSATTAINSFSQFGDEFLFKGSFTDFNANTIPTASRQLVTMTVPRGVQVYVRAQVQISALTTTTALAITSPDELDSSPSGYQDIAGINGGTPISTGFLKRTNTSAQLGFRLSATCSVFVNTFGWIDLRGKQ